MTPLGPNEMSPEEFRHFNATGEWPARCRKPIKDYNKKPPSEKGVTLKPNKYGAAKATRDGITFDSGVEARRYDDLKADPEVRYIDVHPVITLPGGVRYRADFLVWPMTKGAMPRVEDVKGMRPDTGFWRLKQAFDFFHPCRPLVVVRWVQGRWVLITERGEWDTTT